MYRVAIINVDFDRDYKNVLRFETEAERNTFFGLSTLFDDKPLCNFKATSLVKTSITVNYPTSDLTKLLNSNYLIVRNEDNINQYFFYFIDRAEQLSGYNIRVDLTLDVFQTYYIQLSFSPCKIERAHLERIGDIFKSEDNVYVTEWNANPKTSLLFIEEDIPKPPLRVTNRIKATPKCFANEAANEWLRDNIAGWVYLYMQPDVTIDYGTADAPDKVFYHQTKVRYRAYLNEYGRPNDDQHMYTPFNILVFPIYKKDKYIMWASHAVREFGQSWSELAPILPYTYGIKLSALPPFYYEAFGIEIGLTGEIVDGNLKVSNYGSALGMNSFGMDDVGHLQSLHLGTIPLAPIEFYIDQKDLEPDIYQICSTTTPYLSIGAFKSDHHNDAVRVNPKLYADGYRGYSVCLPNGESYSFSQQKINKVNERIGFYYNESVVTPDITRIYIGYKDDTDGAIYSKSVYDSITGLITSGDFSLPFTVDVWQQFLAQNKNFFEQGKYNAGMNFGQTAVRSVANYIGQNAGALAGIATGNVGAVSQVASAPFQMAGDLIAGGMSYAQAIKNLNYQADNLRHAPDQIKNVNGNAFFNMNVNDFALYVELSEPFETDKIRINDIMHMYGYKVGVIGDIKDYDNIRVNFNYIEAEIEEITSDTVTISQDIRDTFVAAFARGVRFWNADRIMSGDEDFLNFEPDNYEKRLEGY